MPIKPFLVISMELIQEFRMDPQSPFWASVASSVKFWMGPKS